MYKIANANPFSTHRTEKKDGTDYLVVKGVAIVEGVLNKYYVPFDEFGAFEKDWDGVPLVLRHPQGNGGSARVPNPDVPVIGNFYGATLEADNRRMTGEYWFSKEKLLSTPEGERIHNDILAGKMIETSTGYFASIENKPGQVSGKTYLGIQRNIHPDHIAVLPDEVGACSIRDGCGINRNSSGVPITNCETCPCKNKGTQNMNDNVPVYTNAESGMDFESSSMIAFMLPDDVKDQVKAAFPFISDDIYNNLHITLAFLGDTGNVDIVRTLWSMFEAAEGQPTINGQVQGMARFISDDDQDAFVLTFDSPLIAKMRERLANTLDWRGVKMPSEHGFIPHITLAYIGKDEELPANTFEPFDLAIDSLALVNGNDVMLTVPLTGGFSGGYVNHQNAQAPSLMTRLESWLDKTFSTHSNKEKNSMEKIKELLKQIANSAGWNVSFDDATKSANVTLNTAAPLSDELTGLESVIKEMGGAEKFKAMMNALAGLPASVQTLADTVNGLGEGVKQASVMAQNAAQEAETKKAGVIARLIANASCPLDEATLKGLSIDNLERLEASFRPTNYAALGGSFQNSTNDLDSDDVLSVPQYAS